MARAPLLSVPGAAPDGRMNEPAPLRARVLWLLQATTRMSGVLATLPQSQWASPIDAYLEQIVQYGTPATALTDAVIIHGVLRVLEESAETPAGDRGAEAASFAEMLCNGTDVTWAATECLRRVVSTSITTWTDPEEQTIRLARQYIHGNLGRRLTVPAIARQAGCNTARLERLFQERLHVTVHEYTAAARIALAAELIAGGEKVLAAMLLVGYRGKSSFNTQFRRRTGLRPGEYRLNRHHASSADAPMPRVSE